MNILHFKTFSITVFGAVGGSKLNKPCKSLGKGFDLICSEKNGNDSFPISNLSLYVNFQSNLRSVVNWFSSDLKCIQTQPYETTESVLKIQLRCICS